MTHPPPLRQQGEHREGRPGLDHQVRRPRRGRSRGLLDVRLPGAQGATRRSRRVPLHLHVTGVHQEPAPKQEREFYIPRLAREKGLCGTQLEIRLRNELTQKSVASECARWIRRKAKFRIPYSARIEKKELGGRECFPVDGNRLVACFDTEVGTETIEEMARLEPDYAVMRDASMRDDATQANFEELFKTYSPDTVRRVI